MAPEGELAYGDENQLAAAIRAALGAGDYERVAVMTPQFERTDGRKVYYSPKTKEEFDAIRNAPESLLKDFGLGVWARAKDGSWTHWLYPSEWYAHIPAGYEIVDISGNREPFEPGKTDDDIRFGLLAYGFVVGDQSMKAAGTDD